MNSIIKDLNDAGIFKYSGYGPDQELYNNMYNTVLNSYSALAKNTLNMIDNTKKPSEVFNDKYFIIKDKIKNEVIDITNYEMESICMARIAREEAKNNEGITSYLIQNNLNIEDVITEDTIKVDKYYLIMEGTEPILMVKSKENAQDICNMKNKNKDKLGLNSFVEYTYKEIGCVDKEL